MRIRRKLIIVWLSFLGLSMNTCGDKPKDASHQQFCRQWGYLYHDTPDDLNYCKGVMK